MWGVETCEEWRRLGGWRVGLEGSAIIRQGGVCRREGVIRREGKCYH